MIDFESKSVFDREQEIRFLIDEGQFFRAYDQSVKALEIYPDDILLVLLGALALINSGAHNRASNMLESISDQLETSDVKASKLYQLFQQCVLKSTSDKIVFNSLDSPKIDSPEVILFSDFARAVQGFSIEKSKIRDIKTLKVAAQVYYQIWENNQQTKYLQLSKNISLECFNLGGSVFDGIRAAILSWISQDKNAAIQLAEIIQNRSLQEFSSFTGQDLSLYYLTLALTYLLLNETQQAIISCQQAMENLHGKYTQIVNMRKSLSLLAKHGLNVPVQLLDILSPPVIVIFAGQAIDRPHCSELFFPTTIEHQVAHHIANMLDEINAEIAYCSAACGSDLLFIEAMLDRGSEVNIILPFAEEDFLNARIRYAGKKWERRFKNALKLANSVTWSTNDPYLNDDELFRYNNLLIEGGARLRAESLQTQPKLMVVMDYLAPDLPGSAADFMDQWADITSLHMIDLDTIREMALENTLAENVKVEVESELTDLTDLTMTELKASTEIKVSTESTLFAPKSRKVKAMLFADIVHYSKLNEEQLPAIFEFLGAIKTKIAEQTKHIDLVESWGDALYVAMNTASEMADYAFALCQAIEDVDHSIYGLIAKPELRIGLHVGPVYEGIHPLTGRKIVFGQHVSRAARIEPITVPGEIYTSEHFVAVLKAEENVARHVAESTNTQFDLKYSPEYIGILELPKKFGNQAVYHLRLS